jgi:hypothetical protein
VSERSRFAAAQQRRGQGVPAARCPRIKIFYHHHEEHAKSGEHLFSEGKSDILVETHSPELERACIEWVQTRGYKCNVNKNPGGES